MIAWLRDRKRRVAAILIAAAALAGISLTVVPSGEKRSERYRSLQVKRGPLTVSLVATGVVQPQNRVGVKPPIGGRVEEILVKEGDQVKKGQVMAWMSSKERAALLDAASSKGEKELAWWKDLYKPTPILSPIDGSIINRAVQAGQTFADSDAVFTLSDRLILKTLVDETDIAQIRKGMPASIVLDAYAENKLTGKVDQIAFDAETINSITTYKVDVVPESPPEYLRSGMTANVTFEIAAKADALLVPAEAVRTSDGKTTVLVPSPAPGLPPSSREIKTGISDGRMVEAREGLKEGDAVLLPDIQWEDDSDAKRRGFFAPGRKSGGG